MSKRYVYGIFITGLLVFPLLAADGRASDRAELVDQVIEASGVHRSMSMVSDTVEGTLSQRRTSMDPEVFSALRESMKDAFDEGRLRERVRRTISERVSERELETVLAWYGKPLARKIRKQETRATEPGAAREMAKFAEEIQVRLPSDSRVRTVQRIMELTQAAELTVDIVTGITKGMMLGMNAAKPEDKRLPESVYDREISGLKPKLRTDVAATNLIAQLFVFRELSDQELEDYEGFLESEEAVSFFSSYGFAVNHAFSRASHDTGSGINRSLASTKATASSD